MADDPYVYPGTDVLCNLLDLRDATELAEREAALSGAEPTSRCPPSDRPSSVARSKGGLHERRLVRAWRVVRVALGCLDVPMPHPLLQSPHWNAGASHCRAESVAQVVEAVRLLKLRGLERAPVAAQDRRLVERPVGVGIEPLKRIEIPQTIAQVREVIADFADLLP